MAVPLQIWTPDDVEAGHAPLDAARWRFLCEGDSWFTIGALNPLKSANLLQHLRFTQTCAAVNCATPGDVLSHMVDRSSDKKFLSLLVGRPMKRRRAWDALLVSGGGNDLIDALAVPAQHDASRRLLLTADEWGPVADGPARYISAAGWQRFADYLQANVGVLVALRDDAASESRGVPLFLHGYAVPTPNDVGAGAGIGPWLSPSLRRYGIPVGDWPALADHLLRRLLGVLQASAAALPNVHVFDSLVDLGIDADDWVNEIHLTARGCGKHAGAWARSIEAEMLAQGR